MESHVKKGGRHEFTQTGRPAVRGTQGAVTSPHYLATQAGKSILQQGGHAVDAAISMNAVLCVVLPHMAGLGGDLFSIISDRKESNIQAINGSGRSGRKAAIGFYKEKGYDEIPDRGPLSSNTVPGTVKAWEDLHQQYGRIKWKDLFTDAIHYAQNGFPLSSKVAQFIFDKQEVLSQHPKTADIFLPDGKPVAEGAVFKQPDLAQSLALIAEKGAEVFYQGDLAEKIVQSLQEEGGVLTLEDFSNHESTWEKPASTSYGSYEIHELHPNTQGLATLMMLNVLKKFDLPSIGDHTPDYYHLMAEAAKLSFHYRDEWVTDPEFLSIPVKKLLSEEHTDKIFEKLDWRKAYPLDKLPEMPKVSTSKDTTFMAAVDSEGNACSLIQSIYHEFGSGFVPEDTGILLQNRGSFFELDAEHPNALEPEKRTFHTIIPAMATKEGKPFMLFGTMGGEGQPQTQAALFTRVVEFGYDIQQAIEAPRWLYGRTWGEDSSSLKLESRIPDSIAGELANRGHEIEKAESFSQQMGHAQGIVIDEKTGVYSAGADPRGDGIALSW
ncbi:gamma-glutamyltransferase [Thalassorhabdus alkalitolerans]|uniref:Glutathione hydrolase proenzyme n=1 Tax=Thalassorhabdus alkalitolerans TaxID=2282697 RepID=A0ABW0YLM4_9BACI